jgi:hypothetical protein
MHRRLVLFLAFCSVVLSSTLAPFGADLREPFSLSYDSLSVKSFQPPPDRAAGYKEMRKVIAGKATDFLEDHLGENYWTKEVAPIVLDSVYATVEASASGHLSLRSPSSILDETANRFASKGKKQLAALSQANLPNLPVIGNVVTDLTESQNLNFKGGKVSYRMKMRKRLAPEFKIGQFSLSGGTEAYLDGRSLSRKSVASIGYKGLDSSYRVQVQDDSVQFDVSRFPVDLRLDWNPRVVKFHLNLDIGNWL